MEISRVQSQLERLSEGLYALVSKKRLEKIKFIRKRAEDIIAKVLNKESDPLGLYHEIYKKRLVQ